jgi:uncharacterized membrane protein YqjE
MIDRVSATLGIAVRQAGAYTDLILSDLDASSRAVRRRVALAGVLVLSIRLALLMGCLGLVALSWDSAFRIWVIGGLVAAFALIAAIAMWRMSMLEAAAPGMLQQTALEWAKDRQLLEELLARGRAEA